MQPVRSIGRATVIHLKPPCEQCGAPVGALGRLVPFRHCARCRLRVWLRAGRDRLVGFLTLHT